MQKNRIKKTDSMFRFMESLAGELRVLGRYRTSETYTSALNSFRKFRDGRDVPIGELDAAMMMSYEAYLKSRGLLANTTSFYMRILRAAYNRASELGLVSPGNPFRYVYTGVGRTVKRAVSLTECSPTAAGRRGSCCRCAGNHACRTLWRNIRVDAPPAYIFCPSLRMPPMRGCAICACRTRSTAT